MDKDLLQQVKASREAKTRAVAGDTKRFEWSRDRAARISGEPYHQIPASYNSPDESNNQRLGDRNNLRGWPKSDVAYQQDVEDRGGATDKWADGRSSPSTTLGSDTALKTPKYVSAGPETSHKPARPAPRMTDNPSGAGAHPRESGTPETSGQSPPGSRPITARRVRGRQP
jgi:hypothetical protein